MTIKQERFMVGQTEFVRTFSDIGMKIHGGIPEDDYDVAEDPAALNRTYTETNIPAEDVTADEALEIIFGG